ncbi:putative peptidase [Aquimixticola soesokkakensis]|uniref:Putative peptidase n=1 Tax=Aquimixticola soesokkakensis TaxID=1519096 RepID=A0A1Y5S8W3_9RHOB|nr:aminopeptidase P family protein [Aquimixticola soesokkakensis]SLN35155.1 putative peptidase [Aquimixticola soesokkakensis]
MFQSFEVSSRPDQAAPRVADLRAQFDAADVDGFLVPRSDAHQNEYVAPCDERLSWISGFTGSAGFAVILRERAAVFVDGRYRVQVHSQVDGRIFEVVHWPETSLSDWLAQNAAGLRIGFDPWLSTLDEVEKADAALAAVNTALIPCPNLIDAIRSDRPAPPVAPVVAHPTQWAGKSSADKRAELAADLRNSRRAAAVITATDSVMWLLNIRGADIARNPVALAFAILHDDARVSLFIDPAKVADLRAHLGPEVGVAPHDAFGAALQQLAGPVQMDRASAFAVASYLTSAEIPIHFAPDICALPKAVKNDTEIAGARAAHIRDAGAMVEFLAWLDGCAPETLSEIDVVRKLESFRQATGDLKEISFDTICGAGPNGAIVHYKVDEASNRRLSRGDILLVDSGGQYVDGTTDITRTIALGPPPPDAIAANTRVLQGMIAVSCARFPKGVAGAHLDALARAPLWRAGQDFDHGTGHGVGSYLCVHEGPQRISRASGVALQPGMILSNEPGYYREGAFGIRIENLITVRVAPPLQQGDARPMYDFETLTYVPFDRRLIDISMLAPFERAWIDSYHTDIVTKLDGRLSPNAAQWLAKACAPLQ